MEQRTSSKESKDLLKKAQTLVNHWYSCTKRGDEISQNIINTFGEVKIFETSFKDLCRLNNKLTQIFDKGSVHILLKPYMG